MKQKVRILIAGGGTGGHLFPGVALAEQLLLRNQGHEVLFVGTRQGIEAREVPRAGFDLEFIEVGGIKGKGLFGWLRGLIRVPRAMWQSRRIIRRFRPDVVVGVGGYASGPVLLSAWLMRLPTAILEQNALPGITNRFLGRFVKQVFVAFPEALRFFHKNKAQLLGNPVRQELVNNLLCRRESSEGLNLLAFGGSQGARVLNQVVPEAAALLKGRFPSLCLVHQTGEKDFEGVKKHYQQLGISADVQIFIRDMASAYRKADLIVSRAGATTVAELSLCRKPAVLVPFPFAADNHQEVNARALVDAGAAVMIRQTELTAERLANESAAILGDSKRRLAMEEAAGQISRPESARDISEACIELGRKSRWQRKDHADAN